jgi:hypothetical protein
MCPVLGLGGSARSARLLLNFFWKDLCISQECGKPSMYDAFRDVCMASMYSRPCVYERMHVCI